MKKKEEEEKEEKNYKPSGFEQAFCQLLVSRLEVRMSGSPDVPTSRGGGSASRRRAQAQRAASRHVAWLSGLLQATASHHAASPLARVIEDMRLEIQSLRQQVHELRSQLPRVPDNNDDGEKKPAMVPEPVQLRSDSRGEVKVVGDEIKSMAEERKQQNDKGSSSSSGAVRVGARVRMLRDAESDCTASRPLRCGLCGVVRNIDHAGDFDISFAGFVQRVWIHATNRHFFTIVEDSDLEVT